MDSGHQYRFTTFKCQNGHKYAGKKLFEVTHPAYWTVTAQAPDETAALYAATAVWGQPWTEYKVYAYATVTRIYQEPERKRKQARIEQGRAKTFQELVEIGKARKYKNPAAWAAQVIRGRKH